MLSKKIDEKAIATKLIMSSLKLEESLINILKAVVKIFNKKNKTTIKDSELLKINKTLKYIIYAIFILDDRIQKGFDILYICKEKDENKT